MHSTFFSARLDNITDVEKTILAAKLKNKLLKQSLIYIPIAILSFIIIIQTNFHYLVGDNETTRAVVNIVFVFAGVFSLRLYIAFLILYSKEKNAWQKKIITGKVLAKGTGWLKIGAEKLKDSAKELAPFSVNDSIEAGISVKSGVLLYIKKLAAN